MTAHDPGDPRLSWTCAAGAGFALYLAHPPVGARVLAFAVPALLVASVHLHPREGARTWVPGAVALGLGYGLVLTWLVPAAGFVAWVLLTLVHAAWGAALGSAIGASRRWPHAGPLLVAIAWVGVDAWRGAVPLGGFDWGTLAAAQVGDAWLRPLARLAGEPAMTLVIVLLGASAAQASVAVLRSVEPASATPLTDRLQAALPAGRTGVSWMAATALVATLATVEPPAPEGELDVLAVQPWAEEDVVGTRAHDRDVAAEALRLTEEAIDASGGTVPDLTIWPEGTVNHDPTTDPEILGTLQAGGAVAEGRLLAGVKLDGPDPARHWFNTATVIREDGSLGDSYRKRRPVPFGEYVPFRDLVDWFPPLQQVPRDMIRGDGPQQVTVAGVRLAIAICFESLFPGIVRSNLLAGEEPAQAVVVSTYDGSFGRVGEAAQHLDQSRLRALETGRWVVHAGASGVTAFVSPTAEVHDVTEVFTTTYRRRTIPLVTGSTPYLTTGDWLGPLTRALVAAAAVVGLATTLRRRRRTHSDDS